MGSKRATLLVTYSQVPNKRGVLIERGSEKIQNVINGGGQNTQGFELRKGFK